MAKTPSAMIPLGSMLPLGALPLVEGADGEGAEGFCLFDICSGSDIRLAELCGPKATVVMFICNHCPYVKHVQDELRRLSDDYTLKGVSFVAINSNDVQAYPDDSPEKMREFASQTGISFPYLYDESQQVARSFGATCTPDFFVYNGDQELVYRGQLDDSRPGSDIAVDGRDLRGALDALIAGRAQVSEQKPSLGCNIKWKPERC
ncbi:MAG: thioredoxin family protein [bacterium]|nr:thioredoxin family protein [bacterium]